MTFRFFVLFLEPLIYPFANQQRFCVYIRTYNSEWTIIKDLSSFAEELLKLDQNLTKASFDVKLLFTNIPSQKTFDFCADISFQSKTCKFP